MILVASPGYTFMNECSFILVSTNTYEGKKCDIIHITLTLASPDSPKVILSDTPKKDSRIKK